MSDNRIELELLLLTEEAIGLTNEANAATAAAEAKQREAMVAISRVELFTAFMQEFPQFLHLSEDEVPLIFNRHAQRHETHQPTGQYL